MLTGQVLATCASLQGERPDSSFEDDPLIDDPVTGAGNEDFWQGDEESCEDGEECGS